MKNPPPFLLILASILLAAWLAACGGASAGDAPSIEVSDPWARAMSMMAGEGGGETQPGGEMGGMGGFNSAAYMLLRNTGGADDRLLGVRSDVAEAVELHISEMKDGVMSMHPVEGVDLPAGGQAELKPGGLHVMLIGLKQELKPGDKVRLTLVFEKSGEMVVEAEVRMP